MRLLTSVERGIKVPSLETWRNARRCLISPPPHCAPIVSASFPQGRKGREWKQGGEPVTGLETDIMSRQEKCCGLATVDKDDAFLAWTVWCAWGRQEVVTKPLITLTGVGSLVCYKWYLFVSQKQYQCWYCEKLLFWTSFRPRGKNLDDIISDRNWGTEWLTAILDQNSGQRSKPDQWSSKVKLFIQTKLYVES